MSGGGGFYHVSPYQRGAGIGSIFSKLFSSVVPLVKGVFRIGAKAAKTQGGRRIIKKAKKIATQAGLNVVSDALEGKNVLDSTKRQLNVVKKKVNREGVKAVQRALAPPPSKKRRRGAKSGSARALATSVGAARVGKRGGGSSAKKRRKDLFDY